MTEANQADDAPHGEAGDKPYDVESVLGKELRTLREGARLPPPSGQSRTDIRPEFAQELFRNELAALCLSGGGIRSASFCLGVLQALAEKKLLSQFDYVSTVSGGGYIGSWLSAWRKLCSVQAGSVGKSATEMVEDQLASAVGAGRSPDKEAPQVEAPQVERLRSYTNYLTPRWGLMSLDTWAGIATIFRNVALNWLLFLPALLLFVAVPKLLLALFVWIPTLSTGFTDWGRLSLLLAAALLYLWTEISTSRELIEIQEQGPDEAARAPKAKDRQKGGEAGSAPEGFGSSDPEVAGWSLPPVFIAAFLTTAVLTQPDDQTLDFWPRNLLLVLAATLIWALSFVFVLLFYTIRRRWALNRRWAQTWRWLVVAKMVGGAGVGACLALGVYCYTSLAPYPSPAAVLTAAIAFFLSAHLVGGFLFAGTTSWMRDPVDRNAIREWMARSGGLFMTAIIGWTLYSALALLDPSNWIATWLSSDEGRIDAILAPLGGLAGLAAAYFGFSPASGRGPTAARLSLENVKWARVAVALAIVFFSILLIELSKVFAWAFEFIPIRAIELMNNFGLMVPETELFKWLVLLAILGLWTMVASWAINVNTFSLHGYYRNRLIRAFIGAADGSRRPNRFTDFDERDNVEMHELDARKPLHVVNVTLNLGADRDLALQERKASSFTLTRLHAGCPELGYRRADSYAGGVKLGTAMAISGAAVSPAMGYHSSPPLAFLMTLFNLRLGWWLGNPKDRQSSSTCTLCKLLRSWIYGPTAAWRKRYPQFALKYLIIELFGLTSDETDFVYLSDGGHFDNLGVYEMLRRRCRVIVAVDAGEDPGFELNELGNIVRKARIDFGVEIEFPSAEAASGQDCLRLGLNNRPKSRASSPYCAVGTILYPDERESGKSGLLIYIKPALHGEEPEDVWSHASKSKFPHDTTFDQFFNESKFESYRCLGRHIARKIFEFSAQPPLRIAAELERRVKHYMEEVED